MAEKSSIDLEPDPKVMLGSLLVDAPRELVWSVWTDPKHLAQWWGPNGFRTTTSTFEFKPGAEGPGSRCAANSRRPRSALGSSGNMGPTRVWCRRWRGSPNMWRE